MNEKEMLYMFVLKQCLLTCQTVYSLLLLPQWAAK